MERFEAVIVGGGQAGLAASHQFTQTGVEHGVHERERIEKMMAIIGTEPVLWVNVKSLPGAPEAYSPENMQKWDDEVERACLTYPNMRVYDWAGDVKDAWFIEDGIHFTSPGYAARAQLIAQALAHAFPEKGNSPGGAKCVVS